MPRAQFYTRSQLGEVRAGYKRRTKWEKWGGDTTWHENLPASTEELEKMVKDVRRQTARRISSLEKNQADSYAAYKLEQELEKFHDRYTDRSDRWALSAELARYHEFWASKGSTVSGAKEINREEDIRIFGSEKRGAIVTPVYRMTTEERKKFWAAYMEFMNQHPEKSTRDNSERIQRLVGNYMNLVRAEDFQRIIDNVMTDLQNTKNELTTEEAQNREWFRSHFE